MSSVIFLSVKGRNRRSLFRVTACRQAGMGGFPFFGCFLTTIRELACGLPERQDAKTSLRRFAPQDSVRYAHFVKSPKRIFSFSFFAQKNFFFFEKEQKTLCQKNQRLTTKGSPEQRREMKNLPERSISGLSDGLLFRLYNVLYSFFKIQNEPMHRP